MQDQCIMSDKPVMPDERIMLDVFIVPGKPLMLDVQRILEEEIMLKVSKFVKLNQNSQRKIALLYKSTKSIQTKGLY